MTSFSPSVHVSKAQVRQFLVDCQCLDGTASPNPKTVMHKLECIQIDPVALVGRNQDLVLNARTGICEPELLDQWLAEGEIVEYHANAASLMPVEDFPLLKGIQRRLFARLEPELKALGSVAEQVAERIEREGPLPARAFDATFRVAGYWDNRGPQTKVTSHALNLLHDMGILRVVGRVGNQRLFDLTLRGLSDAVRGSWENITEEAADAGLLEKYLRAYRVVDWKDPRFGWQPGPFQKRRQMVMTLVSQGKLTPITVDGVAMPYFILTSDLDALDAYQGRAEEDIDEVPIRFLPPLDNLLWRRQRAVDLFDFEYAWEIYTPEMKRRYGAYVMPMLAGSRLIGRVDLRSHRKENTLQVLGIWWEPGIDVNPNLRLRLGQGLESFAQNLKLTGIRVADNWPNR